MKLSDYLEGVSSAAIAGHMHPDGDCTGSCLGLYTYLKENYPEIKTTVYLEEVLPEFRFLKYSDEVRTVYDPAEQPDLLILSDISSIDRIGAAGAAYSPERKTLCLDHHRTNRDSFTWKHNDPEASSASEVVWRFLEPEKVSRACAEALFTGIVHDTGVFQYSCTSPETMRVAASLMEKGVDSSRIIDETYYQKTWTQNHMLGVVLSGCSLHLDGFCISAAVSLKELEENGAGPKDLDGIVSQMRNTSGVDAAILLYETEEGVWKASLRSRNKTDVSVIAQSLGGGGHIRAAGATVKGDPEVILKKILEGIALQKERE